MCIAIAKPKNIIIYEKNLKNCWEVNPDGAGYTYIDKDGELVTKKFLDYDKFIKEYLHDQKEHLDSPILLHFRAASVGDINLDNCHPFQINEGQVFIHNGTIYPMKDNKNQDKSDTYNFNEKILKTMPYEWEKSYGIRIFIEEFIGKNNKIVILTKDGEFTIFNEQEGYWDCGVWWSNKHYTGRYTRGNFGNAVIKSNFNNRTNNNNKDTDPIKDKIEFFKEYRESIRKTPNRKYNQIPVQQSLLHEDDYQFINRKQTEEICEWCEERILTKPRTLLIAATGEYYTTCAACESSLKYMNNLIDVTEEINNQMDRNYWP